ncbi:MAG: Yip1 family protein [Thiohalospira sp.]
MRHLKLPAAILFRPGATLRRLAGEEAPSRGETLRRLTIPLIVLSVVTSQLLYQVIPTGLPPEAIPEPVGFGIYSALLMLLGTLFLALCAHYLLDLFQGRGDFERALQATSLGLVPAWLGNVVAAFPWPWGNTIGALLILYSVVLLQRAFTALLGVRRGNRLGHLFATLVAALFLTFVAGWLLVDLIPGAGPEVRLGTTWLI